MVLGLWMVPGSLVGVPVEEVPEMSLLDETLSRHLESIKRDLESPLEKSLRTEIAGLVKQIKKLKLALSVSEQSYRLQSEQRYRIEPERVTVPVKELEFSMHRSPTDFQLTVSLRFGESELWSLRNTAGLPSLSDHVAQSLRHQIESHLQDLVKQGPERTERAQEGTLGSMVGPHTPRVVSEPSKDPRQAWPYDMDSYGLPTVNRDPGRRP